MAVTLHIEQLVLHGFDPRDRHAIGDALRAELATLFNDSQPPSQSASHDRVDGGSIEVDSVRSANAPKQIANAIHHGVTR